MLFFFCKLLAYLSLKTVHRLGSLVGYGAYLLDPKSNHIALRNIQQSGACTTKREAKALMKASRIEAGKALLETFFIWGSDGSALLPLVREVYGWQLVTQAQTEGKGILFLTPHLGCFEITSIYYGARSPITVLYRPPKLKLLQDMVTAGRAKAQVTLAPATAAGVKKLLQALKSGGAIGILPDQLPKRGEGEWAPFFGKPAYTMALASKLAQKSGATVIMAFGERLANGEGFVIHLREVDKIDSPATMNQAIEQQIRQCPSQYLWQYDRYKKRNAFFSRQKSVSSTADRSSSD